MSFENFVSEGRLAISQSQARDIFDNVIVPKFGVHGDPVENPTYIMIGGQPGSGKSTSIRQAETGLQGATQRIIPDEAFTWLPGYSEQAARDHKWAQIFATDANAIAFITELEERAKERRANVVTEASAPTGSEWYSNEYRQKGYRSELHVIAIPSSLSWTAALDRTERALEGDGLGSNVIIGLSGHEKAYAEWARAVFDAEDKKQYDRVVIKSRDGEILYENELVKKSGKQQWKKSPAALEALLAGRHRPFTTKEVETTQDIWNRVINSNHRSVYEECGEGILLEKSRETTMLDVKREGRKAERSSATTQDLTALVRDDVDFCLSKSNESYGSSLAFESRINNYANNISVGAERHNSERTGGVELSSVAKKDLTKPASHEVDLYSDVSNAIYPRSSDVKSRLALYAGNISARAERHNSERTGRTLQNRVISSFRNISSFTSDFLKNSLGVRQNSQQKPAEKSPSLETVPQKDENGKVAKGTLRSLATKLGTRPAKWASSETVQRENENVGTAKGTLSSLATKLEKPAGKSPFLDTIPEKDESVGTAKSAPRSSATTLGKPDLNKPLPPIPESATLAALSKEGREVVRDMRSIKIDIEALEAGLAKTQQGLRDISQRRQVLSQNAEQYRHSSISGYQTPSGEALEPENKATSTNKENTPAEFKMKRSFDDSRRQSDGHGR